MHSGNSSEHAVVVRAAASAAQQLSESPSLERLFELAAQSAAGGNLGAALQAFRTLALAAPHHYPIWDGLAACHDLLGQPALARTLRILGGVLTLEHLEEAPS